MSPTLRAVSVFCWAVAAAWLVFVSGASAADETTPLDPHCVRLDLEAINFIESHAEDLSQETLGKAGLQFVAARSACREGRTAEGLALYGSILRIEPALAGKK
jgi:hypothetical protein